MKAKIISVAFFVVLLTAALAVVGLIRESIPSAGAIVLAQNQRSYELSCPAGTSVMPGWETYDSATAKWRQILCSNSAGLVFMQPDSAAGAIPATPVSIANGGTGAASFAAAGIATFTGTPTIGHLATFSTTTGQVHDGGAVPTGATVVSNASDCAVTGTTLTNCSGFSFSVTSGTAYHGICFFTGTSSAASTNAQVAWTLPSVTTDNWTISGNAQGLLAMNSILNFSTGTSNSGTAIDFILLPSATGTAQLQVADGTAGDTATLKANSFCIVQ